MRHRLKTLIREPRSEKLLELVGFDTRPEPDGGGEDVVEGILFNPESRGAYPIVGGVPSMLENAFSEPFLSRHREAIARHPSLAALDLKAGDGEDWSFSREWTEHFEAGNDRTWGWTAQERLEQFLMETQTDQQWLEGKLVLDAGCGNGVLSSEISKLGAEVVGIDFSSGVFQAEHQRQSDAVSFAQGDLQAPPFGAETFDLITSIGVLHHTPDTCETFKRVARLVKPGGRFYMWLYRRPEDFLRRYLKVPAFDLARRVISRMPARPQALAVNAYARLVHSLHKQRRTDDIPLGEYLISAYDDLTPMWRYYHTPIEVSRWFHEAGFTAPLLSHWDNPYGFGVVATRAPQAATPGMHFGEGAKLWDEDRTLIG
jgi:2-polyprenyl-3-methyl-5-hydroxy-6-metoxy-1,4-benzoquinol methylase/uncharacterized protein YbaR (Trm112 family)